MRHYEPDSAHAVARVLSLALLADGALDHSEIERIAKTRVLERLGIRAATFDQVMRDFYEDVMVSADYFDAMNFRLTPATMDALLDEVADPDCQSELLGIMLDVTTADGYLSDGERDLLARAIERWGGGGRWPIKMKSSQLQPQLEKTRTCLT